jgi:hypothetical protein
VTVDVKISLHLREMAEGDLLIFFEQQLDPAANHMAAFTAKDPMDRDAFLAHRAKVVADKGITIRTILYEGGVAGYVLCHICGSSHSQVGLLQKRSRRDAKTQRNAKSCLS